MPLEQGLRSWISQNPVAELLFWQPYVLRSIFILKLLLQMSPFMWADQLCITL